MVTTRVKPRGPFYACNKSRTTVPMLIHVAYISNGISVERRGCNDASSLVFRLLEVWPSKLRHEDGVDTTGNTDQFRKYRSAQSSAISGITYDVLRYCGLYLILC
jgi:hypothetical protein